MEAAAAAPGVAGQTQVPTAAAAAADTSPASARATALLTLALPDEEVQAPEEGRAAVAPLPLAGQQGAPALVQVLHRHCHHRHHRCPARPAPVPALSSPPA
jgi:hypothetical protein